jgi:endo-1,4-beta-D-glucanase Y
MLARNASLLALVAAIGSAVFVAGCAKPATVTSTTCNSGQLECSGTCINVQTDSQNCGACGKTCGSGSSCQSGECTCTSGFVSCGGSCVASNAQHCGSSCSACTGTDVCNSDGTCSSTCSSGSKCSDGACSSDTNSADCGTCGNACTGGSTCVNGSCSCGTSSQMVCNGSCVDITTTTNCGSCGNKCGTGQSCSSGNCVGGGSTGGSTGTGGTGPGTGGSTGSGGSSATGGSTGSGGSSATGGSTGTGGTSTGTGGSSTRACAATATVISDFEEGSTGIVTPQGGRQGWWYVFSDATNNAGMSPAASATSGITSAMMSSSDPNYAMCDHWDMEVKTTAAHTTWGAGFGTSLDQILPPPTSTTAKTKNPYDVTAYSGISFNIKSASGTAPPVWFELATLNNQPQPDGTIKTSDGTSGGTASAPSSNGTDEYNTRGQLIKNVGTSWTKVYVPFGTLGPRYLPAATASSCSSTAVKCEAPPFKATDVLGLQFAGYTQFGTNAGTFDLVVDDVAFYTGSNGLATFTAGMLAKDGASLGSCKKPTGATMDQLTNMYANWKATFVVGSGSSTRVQRPENADDTVSEGIAYGMLIAVNMNDKTLFDNLWSYEQQHKAAGNTMTWCIPSGGGGMGSACSASGGSATDADEDMAFALLVAAKQWGGTYSSTASGLISDIWTNDIDKTSMLPTGGSNFGNSTSSQPTNPSYFAPAYYRAFATVDSGHAWGTVASNCYTAISKVANSTTGLVPAWCSNNCSSAGGGSYTDNGVYQYDAHRVPWRLGLDACVNGTTSGNTVLTNNAKFFLNIAAPSSGGGGVGRIYDIYTLAGAVNGDAALNSMSLIGTAGVGAMAVGSSFASTAYQFILDASYSPASTIADSSGHVAYSYFNATVGLMTALTMSGNFNHP